MIIGLVDFYGVLCMWKILTDILPKRRYRVTWLGCCGSWSISEDTWECEAVSKREAHRKFLEYLGPSPRNQYTDDSNLESFHFMKPDIVEI